MVEANQQLRLRCSIAPWERYDPFAIESVGWVPMAEPGAEFVFQVIAEPPEKVVVTQTMNLTFLTGPR